MCGILGFTHIFRRLPRGVLEEAVQSLSHRGPNRQSSFVSQHVSLGSVRLSILDIENGDQPLISPDGDVILTFNGEIFNHQEIRAELEATGVEFRSRCDTETVLQAFLRWDSDCFARLRGMFAISIWVESQRRLLLARDRMGIKPLYYYRDGREVYFGSELKCIFAHPRVPRCLSLDGLNCYLGLNYVPGPHTLVEGITKLMPGELLEWRNGACGIRSYVAPAPERPAPRSIEEACEELDDLMTRAVAEQVVSDVPVGVWLSGGLDSSSVLHYAVQAQPRGLKTFSVTFHGRSFDEARYIKEVSQAFGTEHFEFDLNEDADLADTIEQISYFSDEPSADAGAVPVWYLAKMTRPEATVVLGGEGADELFAGYLTYKANRLAGLARRWPASWRRLALKGAGWLPVSDDKISFEYKLKRFLKGSLLSPQDAHVFWNGTFSEAEKRKIFRFADEAPMAAILADMGKRPRLQNFLNFDQRYYLADDILYKVDRIGMAFSLEVRPPYLDPRIVDFAAALPDDFKLRGDTSKYVLRRLMRDKLPQIVLQRPKVGFDIPIHDWFRGVLRPLLLDTLSQEAVEASGLFRWPVLNRLLRDHLERRANYGYHLWGLLTLFLWIKRWKMEVPTPDTRASLAVVAGS